MMPNDFLIIRMMRKYATTRSSSYHRVLSATNPTAVPAKPLTSRKRLAVLTPSLSKVEVRIVTRKAAAHVIISITRFSKIASSITV